MKKAPLKKRLSYWFDRRMSGGSVGLIRLLAGVTLLIILLIACVIFFCGLGEDGGSSVFNPPLNEVLSLAAGDQLIVIGEF